MSGHILKPFAFVALSEYVGLRLGRLSGRRCKCQDQDSLSKTGLSIQQSIPSDEVLILDLTPGLGLRLVGGLMSGIGDRDVLNTHGLTVSLVARIFAGHFV